MACLSFLGGQVGAPRRPYPYWGGDGPPAEVSMGAGDMEKAVERLRRFTEEYSHYGAESDVLLLDIARVVLALIDKRRAFTDARSSLPTTRRYNGWYFVDWP